jgi:hypothetical protein
MKPHLRLRCMRVGSGPLLVWRLEGPDNLTRWCYASHVAIRQYKEGKFHEI